MVAIKAPLPADGPCIFAGRTATYIGPDDSFDDDKGHVLLRDLPCGICDKTAAALLQLGRADLFLTGATWHYSGDGCC